jgi:hypothetical protein
MSTPQLGLIVPWMFLHLPLIFLAFIGLALLKLPFSILRGLKRARTRSNFLSDYTRRRGYTFLNPELIRWMSKSPGQWVSNFKSRKTMNVQYETEGLTNIREFQSSSKGQGFYFDVAGRRTTVFDHSYSVGNTTHSTVYFRVAKIEERGLPSFRLEPQTTVEKILDFAGVAKKIEFSDHPLFSKRYHVSGLDEASYNTFIAHASVFFGVLLESV